MQQSPKKFLSGGGEPTLMKVSEGHDITVGWRRCVLVTGKPPLLGGGSRTEKTAADEALQALEGDIRAAPWLHWKIGVGGCEFNDG